MRFWLIYLNAVLKIEFFAVMNSLYPRINYEMFLKAS